MGDDQNQKKIVASRFCQLSPAVDVKLDLLLRNTGMAATILPNGSIPRSPCLSSPRDSFSAVELVDERININLARPATD